VHMPCRMSQRRPKPFTGARRHITVQAAAESEEAAEPAPQQPQQQRQKRAQRVVTVPIATIQPGQELEGTVVCVLRRACGGAAAVFTRRHVMFLAHVPAAWRLYSIYDNPRAIGWPQET
jgi:hypothetical protein